MKRIACLTLLLCLSVLPVLTASGEAAAPPPPSAYFPVDKNYVWQFAGEGIEFAEFTRRIEFRRGARAQLSQWNGGTRLMMIFEVSASAVTQTFSREEVYDNPQFFAEPANQATVILKAPLVVGTVWQNTADRREIVAADAKLTLPAGAFANVVVVKISSTGREATDASYTLEYYAPGLGLVMQEYFGPNDMKVVSRLKSFSVQ